MNYDQQIIAKIQPKCDEFCQKVKETKKAQGKTNQEIADATGIPLSNISKFFSGNLTNPSIYNAVAVCMFLGISIDDAFGLKHSESGQNGELESELRDVHMRLDYAEKALNSRRMIIAALFGVCILLTAALSFGVIYDSIKTDAGFIRGNNIAPVSIICITVIVIAVSVAVSIVCGYIYKKRDDNN